MSDNVFPFRSSKPPVHVSPAIMIDPKADPDRPISEQLWSHWRLLVANSNYTSWSEPLYLFDRYLGLISEAFKQCSREELRYDDNLFRFRIDISINSDKDQAYLRWRMIYPEIQGERHPQLISTVIKYEMADPSTLPGLPELLLDNANAFVAHWFNPPAASVAYLTRRLFYPVVMPSFGCLRALKESYPGSRLHGDLTGEAWVAYLVTSSGCLKITACVDMMEKYIKTAYDHYIQ